MNVLPTGAHILFTGSRDISTEQALKIAMYIRSSVPRDAHIIVGDAEGADRVVIETCDELELDIEVHGAYQNNRIKTWTGRNIAHDTDYLGRDTIMASLLQEGDMVVVCWNGVSKKSGTVATARRAAKKCIMAYWLLEKLE